MYKEEAQSSKLAKFLSIYDLAFVDTSFLMEDSFPEFMDTLTNSKEYWKDDFKVIVLGECVAELKKHAKNKKEHLKAIAAKRAIKILRHNFWHGKAITKMKAQHSDGFGDRAILAKVADLRVEQKILILTQDKSLARDVLKNNLSESVHGRYVGVYRLQRDATLAENTGEQPIHQRSNENPKVSPKPNTDRVTENHPKKDVPTHREESRPLVAPKKKPEKPEQTPTVTPSMNSEFGANPGDALTKFMRKKSVLIRDPSVPYSALIHGEYDVTTEDIDAVNRLVLDEKDSAEYHKKNLDGVFTRKGPKLYLFTEQKKEAAPVKKAPKKPLKPTKMEPPKAEEAPQAPKKKAPTKKAEPKPEPAKGEPVLIVAEKPKRQPKKAGPKDAPAEASPEPKPTKAKAPAKKAKAAGGSNETSSEPNAPDALAEAKAWDLKLNANLSNPTYPKKSAKKAVAEQINRLRALAPEETSNFLLSLSDLEAKAKELEESENKE